MLNSFFNSHKLNLLVVISVFLFVSCVKLLYAAENKDSPIIINGDNVEYSADNKEVIATVILRLFIEGQN